VDAQTFPALGFDQASIGLSDIETDVLGRITRDAWLSLATDLITTGQPESCNPLDPDMPSGSEEKIAQRVAAYLRSIGFETELVAAEPGRPNVVGRWAGPSAGPSLAFNTHLDTYPALEADRWTMTGGDPFNPTQHGDWLYARGTSDTRGNMAASLIAARALIESGVKLGGTLMCVYTVNEEKNGPLGSLFLTREKGFKPDAVIVAEPTAWGLGASEWGMSISVANSGHCLIELIVEGVKSHLWRPDVAFNPIDKMIGLIGELSGPTLTYDRSQLAGHTPPSLTCLRLEAGIPGEMQFTPGRCRAVLAGVGLVPGMTMESILADIHKVLDATLAGTRYEATLRPFPGSLFVSGTEAVDPGEQPCLSIRSAYRRLLGKEPLINRKNAFNDTIRFREAGIAAVTFGPGEDSWAPDNEAISISKAVIAAKLYALTAMDFLGVRDSS
jgi:acetylornithine deacetylase/succinyl-diaminopimelate desuccinylase-like protein